MKEVLDISGWPQQEISHKRRILEDVILIEYVQLTMARVAGFGFSVHLVPRMPWLTFAVYRRIVSLLP